MYVVSGCPRSGTSLMMDIFRESLGQERIIGKKFPTERKVVRKNTDTDAIFYYRQYLQQHRGGRDAAEVRDMNPEGFWECPFTVPGVQYLPKTRDLIGKVGSETDPSVCKIVSQGLFRSNPVYIDAVVFMLRHPAAVAKSQERLSRKLQVQHPTTGKDFNLFDGLVVQSPQTFIEVTLQAADWFSAHRNVPLYIVKFEDLIKKPRVTLKRLSKRLGEDLISGVAQIRPELDRSSKVDITHSLLPEAERVHDWFVKKNWGALRAYAVDRTTKQNRQQQQWFCARSSSMAHESICRSCKAGGVFRQTLIDDATRRGLVWETEPCAFDCAYDTQREIHIPLDESAKHNHWKEVG